MAYVKKIFEGTYPSEGYYHVVEVTIRPGDIIYYSINNGPKEKIVANLAFGTGKYESITKYWEVDAKWVGQNANMDTIGFELACQYKPAGKNSKLTIYGLTTWLELWWEPLYQPIDNAPYLKLITSEHYPRPKFRKYVETFIEEINPCIQVYNQINALFNLDIAMGDQLDKIGELLGVTREIPLKLPSGTILEDHFFKKVIRSKIYKNHWDGTREQLNNIMDALFPGTNWDIVDNQDMSVDIFLDNRKLNTVDQLLLENGYYIPKPVGVRYNFHLTSDALFGYDTDTQYIKGWDKGRWQAI